MNIDFFALQSGDELPEISLLVNAEDVRAYLKATGETSVNLWGEDAVPPLVLGALVLAAITERMPLPEGTLHVGQEFEFYRTVKTDEHLTVSASLGRRIERRGRLATTWATELRLLDEVVVVGLTTLMTPTTDSVQ